MWSISIELHMSTSKRHGEPPVSVGEQIRLWRNHFSLTQDQLEERAGLAHNAVSRIENREVSPRLETVESLALAMNLSVEQLQFSRPKLVASRMPRDAGRNGTDSIVQRIASMPPRKAAKAAEAIHRILDLLE